MSNKSLVVLLIAVLVLLAVFGIYYVSSKDKTVKNTSTETQQNISAGTSSTKQQNQATNTATTTNTTNTTTNSTNMNNVNQLQITTTKEGSGAGAKAGNTVTVNYTGTLTNGTKFDSSLDRNQPFSFDLGAGQVIQGWDKGIEGMKVGEKRRLVIPAAMGYGANAVGPIPANSVLIFDVEMLKIN